MNAAQLHATLPLGFDSGASFSPDRLFRYRLWRSWGNREHRCAFVGLNPSTADEAENDHTIMKEIGFAKLWGFGGLDKVNLFGWVSTDPKGLLTVADPIGPENDDCLATVLFEPAVKRIVWCWGEHSVAIRKLIQKRRALFRFAKGHVPAAEMGHLGRTRNGGPKHPLRLSYKTPFQVGNPFA